MLAQLIINDLAIISKLSLDFGSGMTVLTGETGAGKSILLDALGLILGDRADTNIIRGNSEKTDITAIFFIKNNAAVIEKLKSIEIESNNDELLAFNNQPIIGLMPKGQLAKLKTIITKYIELEEVVKDRGAA